MIGQIDRDGVIATLTDDGQWESEDAQLQTFLNLAFPMSEYGPADGDTSSIVISAANAIGATYEIEDKEPAGNGDDDEVVY